MAFKDIFRKKEDMPSKEEEIFERGVIDAEACRKALAKLEEYRKGKIVLENKTIENEDFWKQRQYECYQNPNDKFIPASAWLWNCVVNKHAQLVAAYPAFNVLPRQNADEAEAKVISQILPIVLKQAGYKKTYSRTMRYKVIQGTGITGVFWDGNSNNGLGDIVIKKCDLLSMFWEPGVTDIQDSPHLFYVSLVDVDLLDAEYPEHAGSFSKGNDRLAHYNYDDNVDTSKKAMMVEWYYKKKINGNDTVQYCKFVNETVLYATENDTQPITDENGTVVKPAAAEFGLYYDGKYPFVFDSLFEIEGTPAGYGYTDIGKDAQIQIDMLNNAITKNAMLSYKPRWLARSDVALNIGTFLDWDQDVIPVAGADISDAGLRQVDVNPIGNIYVEVLHDRINELKETLGNRDVNTGGTVSGVTTASGIAALQEAGGRIDKASALETYDAQEEIALMAISRIHQFYTTNRYFRILDEAGQASFVEYKSKYSGDEYPDRPLFDIDITAEKSAPYKSISQNELMLQFYNSGFFDPQNAQAATACLRSMDFDGKEKLIGTIQENNLLMQQLVKLMAIVDAQNGTQFSYSGIGMGGGARRLEENPELSGKEPAHMQKARERAQEATQPI